MSTLPPASRGQLAGARPASGGLYGALRAAGLPQPQRLAASGGSSGTLPPLVVPASQRPPAGASPRLSERVEPALSNRGESTYADSERPLLWAAVERFKQGINVPREFQARWLVRLCGVDDELHLREGADLTEQQVEIMLRELHHAEADVKDRRDARAEALASGAPAAVAPAVLGAPESRAPCGGNRDASARRLWRLQRHSGALEECGPSGHAAAAGDARLTRARAVSPRTPACRASRREGRARRPARGRRGTV